MADNSVRINFIKTFVNTAGVMMDGLQIEKGRDMWYWRSAREVAELYPALKLAAAELNRNCGFRVSVPDDSPQGAFPAAGRATKILSGLGFCLIRAMGISPKMLTPFPTGLRRAAASLTAIG